MATWSRDAVVSFREIPAGLPEGFRLGLVSKAWVAQHAEEIVELEQSTWWAKRGLVWSAQRLMEDRRAASGADLKGGGKWDHFHVVLDAHEHVAGYFCCVRADAVAQDFPVAAHAHQALFGLRLAVASGHQRRGVAKAMLRQAIRRALELGYPEVALQTEEDNRAARSFYERMGMQCTGREDHPGRHGESFVGYVGDCALMLSR
jgi:ribosomal protein S18 acetylase RimI-like enzyme